MNPKEIMDRVHIIVGPNGECMCGSQADGQIRSCKEIVEVAIERLSDEDPKSIKNLHKTCELAKLRELSYGMACGNLNPEDAADYMEIASACSRLESRLSLRFSKNPESNPIQLENQIGDSKKAGSESILQDLVNAKYYKDKLLEIAMLKDKPVAVSCAVKIARNALGMKNESEKRCEWVEKIVNGVRKFVPSCDKETMISPSSSSFLNICPFCKTKTSWTASDSCDNQSKSAKNPCGICGKERKYDPEYDCIEPCNHYVKCTHCGKNILVCVENLCEPLLCAECIKNGVNIGIIVALDESKKVNG